MILYLDSSALVKLYIEEQGSAFVRGAFGSAKVAATCEIAYIELRSALARRHREGGIATAAYRQTLRGIDNGWPQFFLVEVNSQLVHDAGEIAERYGLRAYDAAHLAACLALQAKLEEPVTFACWDKTLIAAATRGSLRTLGQDELHI